MAFHAASRALQAAGKTAAQIDGIIFATVTSERVMPAAACQLQARLGAPAKMAFDVSAACSGFLYGLGLADSLIRSGSYQTLLVVGAETLSRIIDYEDRETCILFGDGAGACVVAASEDEGAGRILSSHMAADGSLGDLLSLEGPGRARADQELENQRGPFVRMRGREIFRCAVKAMSERCREALAANSVSMADIDWLVPHQANIRIIEAVGKNLEIESGRVLSNLAEVGNTSSASIPLALDEAIRDGRVVPGQMLLLAAFGGGLTSSAVLLRL
jgi:3-oxoacyl-[acyl-carrier-protein] synthase-3